MIVDLANDYAHKVDRSEDDEDETMHDAIEMAGEELAMWMGAGEPEKQKKQIATSKEIIGVKVVKDEMQTMVSSGQVPS